MLVLRNGKNWEQIEIPWSPTIVKQVNEKLFVGSKNNFGEIVINEMGQLDFAPLYTSADSLGYVSGITWKENLIYLNGESSISILDYENVDIIKQYFTEDEYPFSNVMILNEKS